EEIAELPVERAGQERRRLRAPGRATAAVRDGHAPLSGAKTADARIQLELVTGAGRRQVTQPPCVPELARDRAVDRAQCSARRSGVVAASGFGRKPFEARCI